MAVKDIGLVEARLFAPDPSMANKTLELVVSRIQNVSRLKEFSVPGEIVARRSFHYFRPIKWLVENFAGQYVPDGRIDVKPNYISLYYDESDSALPEADLVARQMEFYTFFGSIKF